MKRHFGIKRLLALIAIFFVNNRFFPAESSELPWEKWFRDHLIIMGDPNPPVQAKLIASYLDFMCRHMAFFEAIEAAVKTITLDLTPQERFCQVKQAAICGAQDNLDFVANAHAAAYLSILLLSFFDKDLADLSAGQEAASAFAILRVLHVGAPQHPKLRAIFGDPADVPVSS